MAQITTRTYFIACFLIKQTFSAARVSILGLGVKTMKNHKKLQVIKSINKNNNIKNVIHICAMKVLWIFFFIVYFFRICSAKANLWNTRSRYLDTRTILVFLYFFDCTFVLGISIPVFSPNVFHALNKMPSYPKKVNYTQCDNKVTTRWVDGTPTTEVTPVTIW